MSEPEDAVDRIIDATLRRHHADNPAALRRAILEALWESGYEVTRQPDLIPIRRNSGEVPRSPYTPEQEREAQGTAPAELFRRLADEPRNRAIRDKIVEVAGKLNGEVDDLAGGFVSGLRYAV